MDKKATLQLPDGKSLDLPMMPGTVGPEVIDVRALYGKTGYFTYDPGFMSTASCTSTITYIGRMVVGRESSDQLAGPVGMAQLSGDIAKMTAEVSPTVAEFAINLLITLFGLIATISVGIGFINLLPVPVLDGGHLLFYSYEAIARRPLGAKVQAAGYRVGLALVLGLMLFATWNDLQRLRVFNLFGGLFS